MTPTPTPTPEQQAIFDHLSNSANGHLIIDAKAGSGKTTTLVQALPLLTAQNLTISLQAFNRAIADELKQRVNSLGILTAASCSVSTVHSHGLSAFRKAGQRPQTLAGKLAFMLKDQVTHIPPTNPIHRNTRHITRLTSLAKQHGFGLAAADGREHFPAIENPQGWHDLITHFNLDVEFEGGISPDLIVKEAQSLLLASNRRLGSIDFDDMIYLPLLLNLPIPLYDVVMIDEAQDINATRRELAFRTCATGGRIVAVGDPHQAIYGFTGASTDSLAQIANRCTPHVTTLPLSTCWRCDDAVLDEARQIVPTIRTAPAKLGKGQVSTVAFREPANGTNPASDFLSLPTPGDAVLCRLNKPNVAVCLGLLRRGVRAKIEGRDLGSKLLAHAKQSTPLYAHQPLTDTLHDLATYREREVAKLLAKHREMAISLLEDEVDAITLIIERAVELKADAAWPALEALIKDLFGDGTSKAYVTLSSVHKAKGREWGRVFILGRDDYMPFHRATLPWQIEQEHNLIYVALTRAEHELIYVTGVASAIDCNLHREPPL